MKEIQTIISGTKTIAEYKQAKETMIQLTEKAYAKHREQENPWTHGEPIMAEYIPVKLSHMLVYDLKVTYEDGRAYHYDSNVNLAGEVKA